MDAAVTARVLAVVVAAGVLAGCGSSTAGGSTAGGGTSSPVASPSETAGLQDVDGLVIDTTSDRGSMAALVSGVTSLDARGCWMLTTPGDTPKAIVWPLGTRWTDAGRTAVVVRSGVVVTQGQSITAGGGYLDDVARSQVSIASDVRCLTGETLSYVVVNPDVKVVR